MSTDEPILTPAERQSAEKLRSALHDIAAAQPVRVDAPAFTGKASGGRVMGARLPLGLTAALAIVLVAAIAVAAWPRDGTAGLVASPSAVPTEVATLPGTPGHFDDGRVSFDYPTDWQVLGGGQTDSSFVEYVFAVLGNGTWGGGCRTFAAGSMSGTSCGWDTVEVPPGGIVVKVYRWWGGPFVSCRGDVLANETFGSLAVRKRVDASTTSWEIRPPGNEFGQPNNIFVEAHTSDPNQLARAEGLVRSLHFEGSALGPGMGCDSPSAGISTTAP